MKIGIDANEANLTTERVGVGQYAFNIIWELYRQDNQNEYHLYLKQPPLQDLPLPRGNWHYHVFGPQKLWTIIALPIILFTQPTKLDFFYSPNHYSPQFSPSPTIPTIHDLGYLDTPHQFTRRDIYQLVHWTKYSILHAHHLMAVSEFTKKEINRIYNIPLTKITVIPNGVEKLPTYSKKQQLQVLKKFNLISPYLLNLGTLKPNKNIPFLLSAFATFLTLQRANVPAYQLVIAGKKGWLFDNIFQQVKRLHLENRVIFTDYVSQDEKWIIMKNALVTVLPSIYEGFGIPAIESLKLGTPVIASNIPAYQEIIQHAAQLIDPHNESQLVAALNHIQQYDASAIVQKYTWANSAKILINTFNKI